MSNSTHSPHKAAGQTTRELGIVDALVQSSFLVQEILTELGAGHDLTLTQVRLLGVLRGREPRMSELAELLGLTRQSVTGLVDRAARRGLVTRTSPPVGDDRVVHAALAPAGEKLADSVAADVALRVAALTTELSDADRQQLARSLSHLVHEHARSRDLDLRLTGTTR